MKGFQSLFSPGFPAKSLVIKVSFTFQDLVDSDISHKLLHGIVLQVAVAPVHLQSLVTDLRRQHRW